MSSCEKGGFINVIYIIIKHNLNFEHLPSFTLLLVSVMKIGKTAEAPVSDVVLTNSGKPYHTHTHGGWGGGGRHRRESRSYRERLRKRRERSRSASTDVSILQFQMTEAMFLARCIFVLT